MASIERSVDGRDGAHQLELQRQARIAAVAQLVEHRRAVPAARVTTSRSSTRPACSASAARASSASGAEAGTSPSSRVSSSSRRCAEQVADQLAEVLAGGRRARRRRAARRARCAPRRHRRCRAARAPRRCRAARGRRSALTTPPQAVASWSSCETASRNEPRALRAISPSASSSASMPSAAAMRRSTTRISSTDGRANANAWQRPLIVSSSLCGSVVQSTNTTCVGRLLERLQQRVRGVGRERVGLVEDVDLAAAERGLDRDALADLADVVDAAVGRGVELDHVQRGRVVDRAARLAAPCTAWPSARRRRGS